jgi:hypothetical protein
MKNYGNANLHTVLFTRNRNKEEINNPDFGGGFHSFARLIRWFARGTNNR